MQRLLAGESCALVTDAGTPAISDPGEDLVRLCAEQQVPVVSIPGCCAGISALAVSGLPTGRFVFEGFLPVNRRNRRERLEALRREERTILFHEAPHKLLSTLEDLSAAFGPDRRIALVSGADQAPPRRSAALPWQRLPLSIGITPQKESSSW